VGRPLPPIAMRAGYLLNFPLSPDDSHTTAGAVLVVAQYENWFRFRLPFSHPHS